MPLKNMLVTGATGNIGAPLIDLLVAQAMPCVAGVRDVRGYRAANPCRKAVHLDFNAPSSFVPALNRSDGVFLLRPPAVTRVRHTLNRFIDDARTVGIKHIVFSSVIGAEKNPLLPHHWVERYLRESGIGHTIRRQTFFANNLGGEYRDDIRADRRLYLPSRAARVALIDAEDIAAVVATIAQNPVELAARPTPSPGQPAIRSARWPQF